MLNILSLVCSCFKVGLQKNAFCVVFFFFKFHLLVPVTLKNSLIFRKHYNNSIKY